MMSSKIEVVDRDVALILAGKSEAERFRIAWPHVTPPSSETVWYCPPSPVRRNMSTRPAFRSTAAGSQQPPPDGFTC